MWSPAVRTLERVHAACRAVTLRGRSLAGVANLGYFVLHSEGDSRAVGGYGVILEVAAVP